MTAENFCYWLQGYFELTPNRNELPELQVKIIREHLQLVFNKVTTTVETQYCFPEYPQIDIDPNQKWEIKGNKLSNQKAVDGVCFKTTLGSTGYVDNGTQIFAEEWGAKTKDCFYDGVNPNYNPDYQHPLKTTPPFPSC